MEKTNVIVRAMTKTMVEALKIPHFGYKDEVTKMIIIMINVMMTGSLWLKWIWSFHVHMTCTMCFCQWI